MCLSSWFAEFGECLSQIHAEQAVAAAGTELADGFLADLANSLAGEAHFMTDIFEASFLATDAKALGDNLALAFAEYRAEHSHHVALQRLVVDLAIGGKVG